MESMQIVYHPFQNLPNYKNWLAVGITLAFISVMLLAKSWGHFVIGCLAILCVCSFLYWLHIKGTIKFTLTSSHFQQHFFKGGWVVPWTNISRVGQVQLNEQGWGKPLPWIGIKLKDYRPFLNAMSPRITTEILLGQRALLYVGAQEAKLTDSFEDMVLKSTDYVSESGEVFTGLQAMMANRMAYQRQFYGYDFFIAEGDLDRPLEDFVGLLRRYLAATQ